VLPVSRHSTGIYAAGLLRHPAERIEAQAFASALRETKPADTKTAALGTGGAKTPDTKTAALGTSGAKPADTKTAALGTSGGGERSRDEAVGVRRPLMQLVGFASQAVHLVLEVELASLELCDAQVVRRGSDGGVVDLPLEGFVLAGELGQVRLQ
jgi:hypothetical protein